MSQYRRIVSYLYQYLNGEKGQNIGYVRLEQKGRQCRIAVQMRAMETNFMPEVWLFKQKSASIEYISIGKLLAYSGNLQIKTVTNTDDVCSSGHPASDFDGAIIYISDKEYYATTWTNESIHIGEKIDMLSKGIHSRVEEEENVNTDENDESNKSNENSESNESSEHSNDSEDNEDSTVNNAVENNVSEEIQDSKTSHDVMPDSENISDDKVLDDDTATLHITDIEPEPDVRTQDIRDEDICEDSARADEKPAYACGACPFKSYDKKMRILECESLKIFLLCTLLGQET